MTALITGRAVSKESGDMSERINEEFRRRTKTQASLPNEEAVLLLLLGLLRSRQVRLRRLVGWQDLSPISQQSEAA